MDRGRLLVVLMLVCVCEVCECQHWSYGWLPGGKRSIGGELEATFRMMDAGDTIIPLTDEKLQPYEVVNNELEENAVRRSRGPLRRVLPD